MLNHITLMGRLTRDPELRHTQTGTPVASFSLAVERDFSSRDTGEKTTDFIDVVVWRNTAEFVSKYFVKGQLVAVSGRLQIRDWKDKDGNNRRSAEVVADNCYFAESKKSGGAQSYSDYESPAASYANAMPAPQSDFAEIDDDDGDLPF